MDGALTTPDYLATEEGFDSTSVEGSAIIVIKRCQETRHTLYSARELMKSPLAAGLSTYLPRVKGGCQELYVRTPETPASINPDEPGTGAQD